MSHIAVLTGLLATAQSSGAATRSPLSFERHQNEARITDAELAAFDDAHINAVLLVARPDGSEPQANQVVTLGGNPIGFPTQAELEAWADSDDGVKAIQTLVGNGLGLIGMRAITADGTPLHDTDLFHAEHQES